MVTGHTDDSTMTGKQLQKHFISWNLISLVTMILNYFYRIYGNSFEKMYSNNICEPLTLNGIL